MGSGPWMHAAHCGAWPCSTDYGRKRCATGPRVRGVQASGGPVRGGRGKGTNVRRGFTLFELLIVLAVLVILATLVAPEIISQLRGSQVQESGESVREALSECRVTAVSTGLEYQFRYEPGGTAFVFMPRELEPEQANATTGESEVATYTRFSGELPEGIFFQTPEDQEDLIETLSVEWFGDLPNASELTGRQWSSAVVFRYDGSADDREFLVRDEDNRTLDVTVRGLTGSARISIVYQPEE